MYSLSILHLSDVHFKKAKNPISKRVDQIVSAISAHAHEIGQLLVVFSGDIAYSGAKEEYAVANDFTAALLAGLQSINADFVAGVVLVPGNHDCLLSEENSIRAMFLSNLQKNVTHLGADMLQACLKVQSNFREFASGLQLKWVCHPAELSANKVLAIDGKNILVQTYNTAWLSRNPEEQGAMYMPDSQLGPLPEDSFDLSLSVFHHPYNWLEASNARDFRARIEKSSDIVLTGHEHVGDIFRRESADGANDYIEGYVLQDSHDSSNSGFSLLLLDIDKRVSRIVRYSWLGNYYGRIGQDDHRAFSGRGRALGNGFELTNAFRAFLDDPGARYSHPRVGYVTLDQVFEYPDFREVTETDSPKITHNATVDGKTAFGELVRQAKSLVTGPEKSGRTCIGKRITLRLLREGYVPLYISSSRDPQLVNATAIDGLLERLFSEQYKGKWELFMQASRQKRVVIIDDFHLAKINLAGKEALIHRLFLQFGKIIILGDESLRLEDISSRNRSGALFDGFIEFQILEFGRVLRDKVIARWIALGQQQEISEQELQSRLKEYSHAIDTVLGKNLIPAYPVFVLVILQQLEASSHHRTNNGSYGYFYEYLITQALGGRTPGEIDLKYNFLADLAWLLHSRDNRELTEIEYLSFASKYGQEYRITIKAEQMLSELLAVGILNRRSTGHLYFKYKYNFYYFVARWLSQNLSERIARDHVSKLASEIHREQYANILIFLSYLSKDPYILDTILGYSADLYADVAPCDLAEHTKYLNDLQQRVPELVSEEMDGLRSREKALQRLDEHESQASSDHEDEQVAELLKINRAFKTIDVLGQILKNYAGSMRGELKLKIARECVAVALRSMNFFLKLIESNLEGFVNYLVDYYTKKEKVESSEEIVRTAKQLIFFLANSWCVGVIKRVSRAAGSQQLEQIYSDLNLEFGSVSMNLIDVSVRLDHFTAFPKNQIEDLHGQVTNNFFAESVLRRIVVLHLYLFPVDFRIRDSICEQLGIKIEKGKVLDESTKKL